jgi:hypothetical protein
MTTTDLKQQLLSKAFGGVMYNVSEDSELMQLLANNSSLANQLMEEIDIRYCGGIDKGLYNFIKEHNNA